MAKSFHIVPLKKKSVHYNTLVYRVKPDASRQEFRVEEIYRWGQGFRSLDGPVTVDEANSEVRCEPNLGWGFDLDDKCGVIIHFDKSFSESERAGIYKLWDNDGDEGWIMQQRDGWIIDESYNVISRPIRIDLVDEDEYRKVYETDIKPVA